MGVPLLLALLGPASSGPVIVTLVVDLVITSSLLSFRTFSAAVFVLAPAR